MRILPALFLMALLCLAAAVDGWSAPARAAESASRFFQPLQPPRDFQVIVPRGMRQQAPDNSRRAIELCIEDGYEWVQVNIRQSRDGQHVLFADEALDEKTSGHGKLADQDWDKLKELDAGSWFARRYSSVRLLSLPECLTLCKGKINLVLQLHQADPARLVTEIKTAGMVDQVAVRGPDTLLTRVRDVSDGTVPLLTASPTGSLHAAIVEVSVAAFSPDAAQRIKAAGARVAVDLRGERDRPADWDAALASGADMLLTDVPEELVSHVLAGRLAHRRTRFACHRGASRYAPENTLPAFEKAYRLHADYVEFDVRPSLEGHFYLLHDGTLNRTTNGRGPIREASDATVLGLDAGTWFGRPFAGEHVPTLDAFLTKVPHETPSYNVQLYFDAKDIPPEVIAASVAKQGLAERTLVYQGAGFLERVRQANPHIRLMPGAKSEAEVTALAASLKPYAVDTPWRSLSQAYIDHCHARGIKVFADAPPFADLKSYCRAIEWGIDLIQTDFPMRAWRAIELTTPPAPNGAAQIDAKVEK